MVEEGEPGETCPDSQTAFSVVQAWRSASDEEEKVDGRKERKVVGVETSAVARKGDRPGCKRVLRSICGHGRALERERKRFIE